MGRKGVSKRKKAKEKTPQAAGSISTVLGRKTDNQPERVIEKGKFPSKENKKH